LRMTEYSDITYELKTITRQYSVLHKVYGSALSNLKYFNGTVPELSELKFSINSEIISIDFIERKFDIEFHYLRNDGISSGQLNITHLTNENKKVVLSSQEFTANGDVKNTKLSLSDEVETMVVILNLVKAAIESQQAPAI
jgi:hypothetical protein